MADESFALPKSSISEILKMVHAYFLADQKSKGEPVSVPEVAAHAAMDATFLSRNNKFLTAVGLISGGRKKSVTDLGRQLGLSISHTDEERIQKTLAAVVDESDFLSRVKSAVKIRGGMDSAAVQSHIAISAGVPKTREYMTGANAVVQFLLRSGHLVDDGGTLRTADPTPDESAFRSDSEMRVLNSPTTITTSPATVTTTGVPPRARWYGGTVAGWPSPSDHPTLNVTIELKVDDGNVAEMKEFIRELMGLPQKQSEEAGQDEPED